MAGVPKIRSISFVGPEPVDPGCGEAQLRVDLEDGSSSTFRAMTPSRVSAAINEGGCDYGFSQPALFVKSLAQQDLSRAVEAMAANMSGFWLRYYDSRKAGAKNKERSRLRLEAVELTQADPGSAPARCSAVVQVSLSDGRQFSILAATPNWFLETFTQIGLDFYFGPCVFFTRSMEMTLVRRAVSDMLKIGDQWLCRYDTPRTTLPAVLSEFKSRHS
jgi:hypothetical protein